MKSEAREALAARAQGKRKIYRRYAAGRDYILHRGDCMRFLESLPNDSVDLTVTSPPYCIGKPYESSTTTADFVSTHLKVLPEVLRVTKEGGSICWQVGYHVTSRMVVPLDYLIFDILKAFPTVKLRNRIIWTYGHGLHESERFSGRHETVLWFTKGDKYFFDLDPVRVPQKYPGKKHYKGPKKGQYSGNPLGKNPSDIWDIPNVNSKHKEKTSHPCQFPIALAQRLIAALAPRGGLVLDPFSGAGTTGAAAALLGRRFWGAEIDIAYCDISEERMRKAFLGSLPFRSVETPILDPQLAGSVAKRPSHFKWKIDQVLTNDESKAAEV